MPVEKYISQVLRFRQNDMIILSNLEKVMPVNALAMITVAEDRFGSTVFAVDASTWRNDNTYINEM